MGSEPSPWRAGTVEKKWRDIFDENAHVMHDAHEGRFDLGRMPQARRSEIVEVAPDGVFELRIHPVAKRLDDGMFGMLFYNGSIPGPTLRVRQESQISVDIANETDMEMTVHWHGIRLENRYDGVPQLTQTPIPPGGRYTHRLTFPDPGLYWYHPHIREDYTQELGLYGNVIVEPEDPSYWPEVDREVVLTLDDILIEHGQIAPFNLDAPNFAAMGRFGNVLLVGGETRQDLEVERGEVVRFLLTNTANTRVFKVSIPGVPMKLVGGDSGHYEREEWLDDIVIAPSERAIVDAQFDEVGVFTVQHGTPERDYPLATVAIVEPSSEAMRSLGFGTLRVNADMVAERERIGPYTKAQPDKTVALVAMMAERPDVGRSLVYACPMHPEVVSDRPGACPKCGMKLVPSEPIQGGMTGDMGRHLHHAVVHDQGEGADDVGDGIEWEDTMSEVNRATTPAGILWKLVDRDTGKENAQIDWSFSVGDQVKIRIVNEMESDHPMHHPFHIHGQRFLILARDEAPEPNLVWKDTVLIRTGEVVDLLLDASNPGAWMAHCHIPEHVGSGMMFDYRVDR